jgi:hypothetical protein
MKFSADLDHIYGYVRIGRLEGELSEEAYKHFLTLDEADRIEFLWDVGSIKVLDFDIEECGKITEVRWSAE